MCIAFIFQSEEGSELLDAATGKPNVKFLTAMEAEHCSKKDSKIQFTTTNYCVTTTPENEWNIVCKGDLANANMDHGREIPDISKLMHSDSARLSKLSEYEVIAVVIYTGPMVRLRLNMPPMLEFAKKFLLQFQIYNTILRRYPEAKFNALKEMDNLYTTTIYVLVSAIQKIAREVKLPAGTKLYRGLGGDKKLPPFFYKSDEKGCRGMVEWAFMSTTLDKNVAIKYSGVREGKPFPLIFDIDSGAVDRGAMISEFSQYPAEKECLFVPCSFLEPQGGEVMEVTPNGLLGKVRIRLNMNIKSRTCEDLVSLKKEMHISSFKYLLGELEKELKEDSQSDAAVVRAKNDISFAFSWQGYTLDSFVNGIVAQCTDILQAHQRLEPEQFLDDAIYRAVVSESLEVKDMGKYKFKLWLKSPEEAEKIQKQGLKLCQRKWNMMQEKRLAELKGDELATMALDLCKSKGLLKSKIEEMNIFGEVPLLTAAADGERPSNLQLLVLAKADVHVKDPEGRCPIILAAENGHTETVRGLSELKADINARDKQNDTALIQAAAYGHSETVKLLHTLRAAGHKVAGSCSN